MDEEQTAQNLEQAVKKLFPGYIFLNRYTLTLFNLLVVFITAASLWDIMQLLQTGTKEAEDMLTLLGGVGTIIVTYGIVLEERGSLMEICGCYPSHKCDEETAIDQICHDGGIVLLVIGLFLEMAVQFIHIPNRVINTTEIELGIYYFGCVLLALTILHFLNFCYKLLTIKPQGGKASS